MKKLIIAIMALVIANVSTAQSVYTCDRNHTKITFTAVHMGISHVEGRFKTFTVTLKTKKEDFTDAEIEVTMDVKSIDTDIEMRDNDLRSDSWFDANKYPTLSFKSTSFKKVNGNNYKLAGNITIHGVTKPITFDVVYNGKYMNQSTKKYSAGFTISGKLNRKDFSIGTGPGNVVVSDEITLGANAEFIVD